jgi:hypothetical protein
MNWKESGRKQYQLIGMDVVGSSLGLINALSWHLHAGTKGNHEKPQLR